MNHEVEMTDGTGAKCETRIFCLLNPDTGLYRVRYKGCADYMRLERAMEYLVDRGWRRVETGRTK
jgi:hypothetical protein